MRIVILALLVNLSCMKSTPNTLEYDPVTPEESSTGMYSGGDPVTVSITSEQFESIRNLIHGAISNQAVHIKDRIKTSGAIDLVEGQTHKHVILDPKCAEKAAIENLLKKVIADQKR
jgi:hypothetical protein